MSEASMKVEESDWQSVCQESDLVKNIGVCALVGEHQVAIFKMDNGDIYAVDNFDPFSDANVLSRGICGDVKGQPVISSPIYKQHFNLNNGQCLEDESVKISVYQVRIIDGNVQIAES
jgi:nitrite reductase (NADH) small subunit